MNFIKFFCEVTIDDMVIEADVECLSLTFYELGSTQHGNDEDS
jgi:hypothetical protein